MKEEKCKFENAVDWYYGNTIDESTNTETINTLNEFINKDFYCWNTKLLEKATCCFNHLVGLPYESKSEQIKPLFPYEKEIFQVWEKFRHLWILKATGLGVSEFFLRVMLWLCVRNNDYRNCQMCIVTGPNIKLAKKLIKRMRNIIRDYPGFSFDKQNDYQLEVNACAIEAYPSFNIDAFRSLDKPKFIFLDEADFFVQTEFSEIRNVAERYIAKSKPSIVIVSTPNRPDGLMAQIEQEKDSIYYKMKLNYEVGQGYIYSKEDIQQAMKSPSFEQEYNLKYYGKIGNVWSPSLIQYCIEKGEQYRKYPIDKYSYYPCGVDYGYGSDSKTVICVGQWIKEENVLKIVKMDDFGDTPPTPELVANRMFEYYVGYGPNTHFFVDGSNAGSVNQAKIKFGENMNWRKQDAFNKSDRIHPIHFGVDREHTKLLFNMYDLCTKGMLAIDEQYQKLIVSMRTAQADMWDLDKDNTVNNDYLDACRLMTKGIKLK